MSSIALLIGFRAFILHLWPSTATKRGVVNAHLLPVTSETNGFAAQMVTSAFTEFGRAVGVAAVSQMMVS